MAGRRTGWIQWACLVVMLGALCLGVPRHAGPDEPAHAIRAAGLVRGQLLGDASEQGEAYRLFHVPAWVDQPAPDCFAFAEQNRAGCATVDGRTDSVELPSSAASYPPFAHVLPGLGTLVGGSARSLWLSRLLGALLCSGLVAAALHRFRRSGSALAASATMLALTPAALFSMSVINPSGPTVAGAVALVAGLICLDDGDRGAEWLVAGGAAALALSRSDGWFWLAALVAVTCLLLRRDPRRLWHSLGEVSRWSVVAVFAIGAAWSAIVRPRFVPVPTELEGTALISQVLRRTTIHLDEAVGLFGWFDTSIPALAYYAWWAALGGLAMVCYVTGHRRQLVVAAVSLAGFVVAGWMGDLIPSSQVGLVWQGRYALPLLIVGVIALGYRAAGARPSSPDRSAASVIGLSAVLIWNVGFFQAMRRWSVGADGPLSPFDWEKGGSAVHPLLCLCVFAVASACLWYVNFAPEEPAVQG